MNVEEKIIKLKRVLVDREDKHGVKPKMYINNKAHEYFNSISGSVPWSANNKLAKRFQFFDWNCKVLLDSEIEYLQISIKSTGNTFKKYDPTKELILLLPENINPGITKVSDKLFNS